MEKTTYESKHFSWIVISEETVIKQCDKSFFEYQVTGVPKELRWFFDAEGLEDGQILEVKLYYLNKQYIARIDSVQGRCRIHWNADLSNELRKHYDYDSDTFPEMRFFKIDNDKYRLEFINVSYVEREKKEGLESVSFDAEGGRRFFYTSKYERSPRNRKAAIRIHGLKCMICGFDFEEFYGDAGKNYIEVHHLKPLSNIEQEVVIDPTTDLACLCANCHRIVHRKPNGVYTLDEVKNMIGNK